MLPGYLLQEAQAATTPPVQTPAQAYQPAAQPPPRALAPPNPFAALAPLTGLGADPSKIITYSPFTPPRSDLRGYGESSPGVGYQLHLPTQALVGDQVWSDTWPVPYVGPLSMDNSGTCGPIETAEMRRLYRELYRREPSVRAAVNGKADAVACLDVSVVPRDSRNPNDCEAAEFVKWTVENTLLGWDGLIRQIVTPAIIDGWSVLEKTAQIVEPEWGREWQGKYGLLHCRMLDTAWVRLQLDQFRNVLSVVNMVRGLQYYNVDKFILFSYSSLWNNPFGQSDLRACVRSCALIEDAYKLWYLALKMFGMPYLHGKVEVPAQREMMADALAALRAGGYAVTGKGDEIELLNLASAASFSAFEENIRAMREDNFMAIRGAYLPFLEGVGGPDAHGNTAISKVASDTNTDLLAKSVARVLSHQLVPWLVKDNFPKGTGYPTVTLGGTSWDEVSASLEVGMTLLNEYGLPLSKEQTYKRANWAPPDGPDDVVDAVEFKTRMEAAEAKVQMQVQAQQAQLQMAAQQQQQAAQAQQAQQQQPPDGGGGQPPAGGGGGGPPPPQGGGGGGEQFELSQPQPAAFSEDAGKASKPHKFACVYAALSDELAKHIRSFHKQIREEDLADRGYETEAHVTVRYGLHATDPNEAVDALEGAKPFEVRFDRPSFFAGAADKDYDVIKLDVLDGFDGELRDLHDALGELPHTDTHKDYRPHATIAYVKKGKGKDYCDRMHYPRKTFTDTVTNLVFSGKDKAKTTIPLDREKFRNTRAFSDDALTPERFAALGRSLLAELGPVRAFADESDESPSRSKKAIAAVREAVEQLTSDESDGLCVYAHADGPKFWIDAMDWHEGEGAKLVIKAAEKVARKKAVDGYKFRREDGEGYDLPDGAGVYTFNESSPPGDDWLDLTRDASTQTFSEPPPADHHRGLVHTPEDATHARAHADALEQQGRAAHAEVVRTSPRTERLSYYPEELAAHRERGFYCRPESKNGAPHVALYQVAAERHADAPDARHLLHWRVPVADRGAQWALLGRLRKEGALPPAKMGDAPPEPDTFAEPPKVKVTPVVGHPEGDHDFLPPALPKGGKSPPSGRKPFGVGSVSKSWLEGAGPVGPSPRVNLPPVPGARAPKPVAAGATLDPADVAAERSGRSSGPAPAPKPVAAPPEIDRTGPAPVRKGFFGRLKDSVAGSLGDFGREITEAIPAAGRVANAVKKAVVTGVKEPPQTWGTGDIARPTGAPRGGAPALPGEKARGSAPWSPPAPAPAPLTPAAPVAGASGSAPPSAPPPPPAPGTPPPTPAPSAAPAKPAADPHAATDPDKLPPDHPHAKILQKHAAWVGKKVQELAADHNIDPVKGAAVLRQAMLMALQTNKPVAITLRGKDGSRKSATLKRKFSEGGGYDVPLVIRLVRKPVGRTFSEWAVMPEAVMFSMAFAADIAAAPAPVTMAQKPIKPGDAAVNPTEPTQPAFDPHAHARKQFEAAIASNPFVAINHLVYADHLDETGDHDEAAFRRALAGLLSGRDRHTRHTSTVQDSVVRRSTLGMPAWGFVPKFDGWFEGHPVPPDTDAFNRGWRSYQEMESALRQAFHSHRRAREPRLVTPDAIDHNAPTKPKT